MGRVPVLFMRINVAKEDVYLCRILAVEVRRVKCVFPRNEVQKEIEAFPRRTENRTEWSERWCCGVTGEYCV